MSGARLSDCVVGQARSVVTATNGDSVNIADDRADVLEALLTERSSCRAFLPDPVPDDVLDRLLRMAQTSASWCNTQPWHTVVVRGDRLEQLRVKLHEYALSHKEGPDFDFPERYEGVYRDRRRCCAQQLYGSLGIGREDRETAFRQAMENFRFFGAPAAAFITSDAGLGTYGAIDCGLYLGNFLLAAQALGLSAIPQAALAAHAGFIRSELSIPPHRLLVAGVSFGYGDSSHAANGFRTTRASTAEASTLIT